MRVHADDDINHLLLSCHFTGELGSGMRYAYARLDTIDRKASEIFRSFTWVLGLLGGIAALIRQSMAWKAPGDLTPSQILVLLCFVVLVVIAVAIFVIHRQISNLRYYRIGVGSLDATVRLDARPLSAADPVVRDYVREISAVTVFRERQLAVMAALHTAGLCVAAVLLACLILVAAPLPR